MIEKNYNCKELGFEQSQKNPLKREDFLSQ